MEACVTISLLVFKMLQDTLLAILLLKSCMKYKALLLGDIFLNLPSVKLLSVSGVCVHLAPKISLGV